MNFSLDEEREREREREREIFCSIVLINQFFTRVLHPISSDSAAMILVLSKFSSLIAIDCVLLQKGFWCFVDHESRLFPL